MSRDEILEKFTEILKENFELNLPDKINYGDKLFDNLGIDSISLFQVIVYLEDKFNITIPENEINPEFFKTVDNIVTFIQSLL